MNKYSNVEGVTGGGGIKFIKEAYIKKPATSVPRFDGTGECDELELSNFSALDSNVKNMVSKEIVDYGFSGVKTNLASPKLAPKVDYNADGEEAKVAASTTESSLVKPVSVSPVEKKILGMRPKVAYGVGAAILIAAGTFVYFKYIKK
jgi:hypothetical protein